MRILSFDYHTLLVVVFQIVLKPTIVHHWSFR